MLFFHTRGTKVHRRNPSHHVKVQALARGPSTPFSARIPRTCHLTKNLKHSEVKISQASQVFPKAMTKKKFGAPLSALQGACRKSRSRSRNQVASSQRRPSLTQSQAEIDESSRRLVCSGGGSEDARPFLRESSRDHPRPTTAGPATGHSGRDGGRDETRSTARPGLDSALV